MFHICSFYSFLQREREGKLRIDQTWSLFRLNSEVFGQFIVHSLRVWGWVTNVTGQKTRERKQTEKGRGRKKGEREIEIEIEKTWSWLGFVSSRNTLFSSLSVLREVKQCLIMYICYVYIIKYTSSLSPCLSNGFFFLLCHAFFSDGFLQKNLWERGK